MNNRAFHHNDTKFDKKIVMLTERWGFKLALFSMAAMTILGNAVISTALPQISSHFETLIVNKHSFTATHLDVLVRLILTMPAVVVMLLSPVAGHLMDSFGKLKFVYPAMALWSLAGVSGYFLNNIYYILASRAIFGIATAFIMTGASALLADYFSKGGFNRRESALSLQSFFCAVGGSIFISLGGFLSSFSWRLPFLVYGSGILIIILASFFLFEPRKLKFFDEEEKNDHVNYWRFFAIYFVGFFNMLVFYIIPTQLPYFMENQLHVDPKYIGFSIALSAFFYGLFSLFYKNVAKYLSIKNIYSISFVIMGLTYLSLYLFHSYWAINFALMLIGIGGGFMLVNNSAYLFKICPAHSRGKAYGILASCMFFGQFISPMVTQPIVRVIGLVEMFLVCAILVFAVTIFFHLFFRGHHQGRLH